MIDWPQLRCKGKCQASCGPVPMTATEVAALQEATGMTFSVVPYLDRFMLAEALGEDLRCPALGADGRCHGYEGRPAICRMFGMVDNDKMRCPHGCRPSRWLTHEEELSLLSLGQAGARSARPT